MGKHKLNEQEHIARFPDRWALRFLVGCSLARFPLEQFPTQRPPQARREICQSKDSVCLSKVHRGNKSWSGVGVTGPG